MRFPWFKKFGVGKKKPRGVEVVERLEVSLVMHSRSMHKEPLARSSTTQPALHPRRSGRLRATQLHRDKLLESAIASEMEVFLANLGPLHGTTLLPEERLGHIPAEPEHPNCLLLLS